MYVLIRPPKSRHSEPRNSHIASLLLEMPVVAACPPWVSRSSLSSGMSVRCVRSSWVSTVGAGPGVGSPPIGMSSSIVSVSRVCVSAGSLPRSGAPCPGVFSSGGVPPTSLAHDEPTVASPLPASGSGGTGSYSESGATDGSSAHPNMPNTRIDDTDDGEEVL